MTSRTRLKASTLSLVVLGALSLNGCAGKQVWSPELESATKTYQEIAQDPLVSALAAEELAMAERQLQRAQTAQDQYKPVSWVQHEAQVAQLKTLTAQQRARALSANHKLQVAMGQQTLLSEATLMAAAPPPPEIEPTMAAATPFDMSGPYYAGAQGDIEAQLAALSQQLAALQIQLQAQSATIDTPQTLTAPQAQTNATPVAPVAAPIGDLPLISADPAGLESEMAQQTAAASSTDIAAEPAIAAAMSVQQEQQPLPSAKQLHRELLAMNARSNSRGMALTLGDRYFEGRSSRLWSKRAARHLDNVAGFLDRNPRLSLDIEAHTDDEASSEENHDLSIDRATAIKSQLVLRGIEESRINATGFGESRPIAGNDNPLGRLQNRRVELIFPNIPAANI